MKKYHITSGTILGDFCFKYFHVIVSPSTGNILGVGPVATQDIVTVTWNQEVIKLLSRDRSVCFYLSSRIEVF